MTIDRDSHIYDGWYLDEVYKLDPPYEAYSPQRVNPGHGPDQWSAARRTPDQHQITATRGSAQPDIGSQLEQTFATGAAGNAGGVSDPKIDAWIKAQRAEPDPVKRREVIREATKYLSTDLVGAIGLNHEPGYIFWQPDLMNYYPSLWQGPQGTALENVWRDK